MWQAIIKNQQGAELRAPVELSGSRITIGRGLDCAIVLDSKLVSRLHASISVDGGRLLFKDEGSANGSEINGQAVTTPVAIDEATRIGIAEFFIELRRAGTIAVDAAKVAVAPAIKSPTAEIAGFRFKEAPPPRATTVEAEAATFSDSITSMLDKQMRGIQSQREELERNQRSEREQFDDEWREAATAARELRVRYGKHPKVLYFVISRDEGEIAVKVSEGSRRGHCNLMLSRKHPEKDAMIDGQCWFAESGMQPESFRHPRDALASFVRVLAAMLA